MVDNKGKKKVSGQEPAKEEVTPTDVDVTSPASTAEPPSSPSSPTEPIAPEAENAGDPAKKGKQMKSEKEAAKPDKEGAKETPAKPGKPKAPEALPILKQVHEKYGKSALMLLGSTEVAPVPSISTGCLSLDLALGVKGIPRGRINEIYGPESSGKTTLALHVIANAQKAGGNAAFVDAEHALDPVYCKNIGVDIANLYISQPDNGEQALDIVEMLVASNSFDVIVVDSVAALVPKAELAGEMGDSHVGLQARLMSQALRKLAGIINKTNTCVIFINQLREKIGVFFGNPETTTGGRALKFYTSVRIEIRKIESVKRNDAIVGSKVRAKVVKNKVAAPFKDAEFEIEFGKGIAWARDIADMALAYGLVKKQQNYYRYLQEPLAMNKDAYFEYLNTHPELCQQIAQVLLEEISKGTLTKIPKKKEGKKIQDADVVVEEEEEEEEEEKVVVAEEPPKPPADAAPANPGA